MTAGRSLRTIRAATSLRFHKSGTGAHCYILSPPTEETEMHNYIDGYKNVIRFNEQLLAATVEYWTAWSYPAIYFARHL